MSAVAPRQERYFNPRSHEGSDELGLLIAQVAGIFQSSLPRGERPTPKPATTAGSDFNPRSHEGSDNASETISCMMKYFNPRSHEGSDHIPVDMVCFVIISILAPTRGATVFRMAQRVRCPYFNPRSHEGSDAVKILMIPKIIISILAPTRGATSNAKSGAFALRYFNPRSHEGSDRLLPTFWLPTEEFQSSLPRGERHR